MRNKQVQKWRQEDGMEKNSTGTPLAISNREEDELRKQMRARALKECDPLVRQYAECQTGRTVSVVWACREQMKGVKDCMRGIMGEEAMKERRKEFLLEKRNKQGMIDGTG